MSNGATQQSPPKVPFRERSGSLVLEIITAAAAAVALVISIVTAWTSNAAQRDVAEYDTIRTEYELFLDLAKEQVEEWQVSHMFALPTTYWPVRTEVELTVVNAEASKRAELRLKERAIALQIFTMYEHALYQYDQARSARQDKRAEFLGAVLDYFTGRILRNPRLAHYWDEGAGGLELYFEDRTREYYDEKVLKDGAVSADHAGPFAL